MSALLLLPGMTLNATIFPDLGIPALTVDFNRLVLGRDGSGRALIEGRMGLYARMLQDHLAGDPDWESAPRIVVGHSFGGMLALDWLATYGTPIDGLVLIATAAGPMFDCAKVRIAIGSREWRLPMSPMIPWWNTPWVTRAVKRLVSGPRLQVEHVDFRTLGSCTDLAVDLAGWHNTDWRAMRSYRIALDGFDLRDRLSEIDVPVTVLHGSEDTILPVAVARQLTALLPQADLRIVPGAGHALPLTHGRWVTEAVAEMAE